MVKRTETAIAGSPADDPLATRLTASGKLTGATLAQIQQMDYARDGSLGRLLIKLGLVAERDVAEALADIHAAPLIERPAYPECGMSGYQFSARFLRESEVLPLFDRGDGVELAMVDPGDAFAKESIRLICGKTVQPRTALRSELLPAVDELYGRSAEQTMSAAAHGRPGVLEQWEDRVSDAPVISEVNEFIRDAVTQRASDIHIEPFEDELKIRYRVDGELYEARRLPITAAAAISARLKLLGHLDLAERRLPQGGRFQMDVEGSQVDMRIATMPVQHGENVVLRLLHRKDAVLELDELGFSGSVMQGLQEVLECNQGLILVSGPTGSGKTTTLYSALDKLNSPSRKLITVEDPVEYQMAGINQIQVKPDIGLSFAAALRSVLRLDPDVVMVGEIRDPETAAIAIQAGLTGHLVLSTLHTNNAAAAVTRLADMGIESYLVSSTLVAVLAQRLVRRLCRQCRAPAPPDEATRALFAQHARSVSIGNVFSAAGCPACRGTGFHGRVAIGELLVVHETMRQHIAQHGHGDIEPMAREQGMVTLLADSLDKVANGLTTAQEVVRQLRA